MIVELAFALGSLVGASQQEAQPAKDPKVLMVFIDGFLPDAIEKTSTPNIDRLMKRAAWSLKARAESTTISGSGYSTFLTGVHWDKHGVPDNAFETPRYDEYPHVGVLLREARPDARFVNANMWEPIERLLVTPAAPDVRIYHDYYAFDDDLFDAQSADSMCVRELAITLATEDLDLAVMMFGELDGVGHSDGNAHYHADDPLFLRMLTKIDGELGELLDAIAARPTASAEDWMVLVSADHGGSAGAGHGQNIPSHRTIPLIVSGGGVRRGEIWPPPMPVDLVPTALAHLGVAIEDAWDLDGIVLGRERTRPPRPALGENLIFNGGAEHERGFAHSSGAPDASLAGWFDPGWMTAIAYGSPDGFPAIADAPPGGGRNFFCGGATTEGSFIEQHVDLRPLRARAGERDLRFELSAWLGGFAEQADACRVTLWSGAEGEEVALATLDGPTAAEREGGTSFRFREATGPIPEGLETLVVRLEAIPGEGTNDGYADELSLIVTADD